MKRIAIRFLDLLIVYLLALRGGHVAVDLHGHLVYGALMSGAEYQRYRLIAMGIVSRDPEVVKARAK